MMVVHLFVREVKQNLFNLLDQQLNKQLLTLDQFVIISPPIIKE